MVDKKARHGKAVVTNYYIFIQCVCFFFLFILDIKFVGRTYIFCINSYFYETDISNKKTPRTSCGLGETRDLKLLPRR